MIFDDALFDQFLRDRQQSLHQAENCQAEKPCMACEFREFVSTVPANTAVNMKAKADRDPRAAMGVFMYLGWCVGQEIMKRHKASLQ